MRRLAVLALLVVVGADAAGAEPLETALARFAAGHERELGPAAFTAGTVAGCGEARHLASPALADPATGPLVLDHGATRPDVVILFHGLSDSPFFMCGLARAFFAAGANVVLPLLTGHGLAEPLPGAHGPELAERWKADAEAALAFARTRGGRISAGGLSTGGVLAVWLERRHPELVDGGLFLFSAAFDFARRLQLAAWCSGTVADRARNPLRRWCRGVLVPLVQAAERGATWRGRNPFRMRFSEYGALELGLLRRATLQALADDPLDAPLFVAHSTADTVAPIAGVDRLTARHAAPARVTRFVVDDARAANCRALTSDCERPAGLTPPCGVPHAGLVLAEPIRRDGSADGPICEVANPAFEAMAAAAVGFLNDLP